MDIVIMTCVSQVRHPSVDTPGARVPLLTCTCALTSRRFGQLGTLLQSCRTYHATANPRGQQAPCRYYPAEVEHTLPFADFVFVRWAVPSLNLIKLTCLQLPQSQNGS